MMIDIGTFQESFWNDSWTKFSSLQGALSCNNLIHTVKAINMLQCWQVNTNGHSIPTHPGVPSSHDGFLEKNQEKPVEFMGACRNPVGLLQILL